LGNGPSPVFKIPYPVNGETTGLDHDVVISPAVATNTIRVVVKWKKDPSITFKIFGNVYKQGIGFATSTVSGAATSSFAGYVGALSKFGTTAICTGITTNTDKYWVPTGCNPLLQIGGSGSDETRVEVHEDIEGNEYAISSLTIEMGKTDADVNNENIAFFVEAITNSTTPRPIAQFTDTKYEVEVNVYSHRNGNYNNLSSFFAPYRIYKLNLAKDTSSNPMARYWHVFNLISDTNGTYNVRYIYEGGYTSIHNNHYEYRRENGTIETGWQQVRCNIPNESVNEADCG
jgi:hypothetical protein